MTVYSILGLLSPLIAALGYIPYIIALRKGTIKPHPFSWLLWAILGGVTLAAYLGTGATDTVPFAVLNVVGPFLIFFFTIKHWRGGFSVFDYACLGFSLLALLIYIVFKNAAFALSLNLFADFIGYLPTIRKTYKKPASEDLLTWVLFCTGASLSIFAISEWTYGIAVFPIYMVSLNVVIIALILRGRLKKAR